MSRQVSTRFSKLNSHIDPVRGRTLLLLSKDVDVPPRRVGRVRDVVPSGGLAQLADLLDLLGSQVDLLEVLDDAVRGDRLGDHAVVAHLRPRQDHLRRRDRRAQTMRYRVGDLLDLVAGDEQWLADHVVPKGRVRRDVDVLLATVADQRLGQEERVALDLVDGGDESGGPDDGLELHSLAGWLCLIRLLVRKKSYVVNGKVGNPNGAGLGLGQLGHDLPGVHDGDGVVDGRFVLVLLLQREQIGAGLESDGPVNEVELLRLATEPVHKRNFQHIRPGSPAPARPDTRPGPSRCRWGGAGSSTAWR